ncbi:hypothetical protein ACH4CE_25180 [Streptomyces gelaticus]
MGDRPGRPDLLRQADGYRHRQLF